MALHFEPDRGVVPRQGEIDVKGFAQVIKTDDRSRRAGPALPHAGRFIDLQYLKNSRTTVIGGSAGIDLNVIFLDALAAGDQLDDAADVAADIGQIGDRKAVF